jgi:hypothetical protein
MYSINKASCQAAFASKLAPTMGLEYDRESLAGYQAASSKRLYPNPTAPLTFRYFQHPHPNR